MKPNLTDGHIVKTLFALSWPTMIAFILQTGYNIVDTIYVGMINPTAIAAVSLVFPVLMVIFALAGGIGAGTTSLVARYTGAKETKKADNAAEHALLLALVLGLFFSVIGIIFTKPIFVFMGASGLLLEYVLAYSKWIFLGATVMLVGMICGAILRGTGDMKTPMRYMLIGSVLNIILDPIFIFGFWFVPAWGVEGAAIATLISRIIGAGGMLVYVLKSKASVNLNLKDFKFNLLYIKQIMHVGFPQSISQLFMSFGILVLNKIAAGFGPLAIAAYGIGFKLDAVAFLPCIGMAMAVITMVGQNIGAGRIDRAEKIAWSATYICVGIMAVVGLVFFLFPSFWMSIFTNDAELIALGMSYIRIVSLTYGLVGVGFILSSAFQGAGKGVPSLIVQGLRLLVFTIPGAYILSQIYGINGIWIAIAGSNIIAALVVGVWFKVWITHKVALTEK